MKKRIIIIILAVLIIVTPIPTSKAKDGGTRAYTSLTYKIVDWNHFYGDEVKIFDKTKIYFFPNNFKSLDELLEFEHIN